MTGLNQNNAQTAMTGGASASGAGGLVYTIEQSTNLISLGLIAVGALVGICGLVLNFHFQRLRNEREQEAHNKLMGREDERIDDGDAKRIEGVDHGQ